MLGRMGCRASRCRRRGIELTDPKQDRLGQDLGDREAVRLSGRDLEDARRLLRLLTEAEHEPDTPNPSRALYERLQGGSSKLQQRARQLLALRQRRTQFFGKSMFGEPAWDILLVLYSAGEGLTMNRLAVMSGVSQATGLRWMNYLTDQKFIARESHPTDARSLRVRLTEKGKAQLDAYLSDALELGGC